MISDFETDPCRVPTGPPRSLVIGYGSPLRRDDAAGLHVAARFALRSDADMLNLEVCTVIQLVPELAERVARVELVVFVDARAERTDGGVELELLFGGGAERLPFAHVSSPAGILSLAAAVYGRCAEGWLVTIPGCDFALGDGLSSRAHDHVEEAIAVIDRLVSSRRQQGR